MKLRSVIDETYKLYQCLNIKCEKKGMDSYLGSCKERLTKIFQIEKVDSNYYLNLETPWCFL